MKFPERQGDWVDILDPASINTDGILHEEVFSDESEVQGYIILTFFIHQLKTVKYLFNI